jgi:hypothetical protein
VAYPAAASMGGRGNVQQNDRKPALACRLCPGPGRVLYDDADAVALDASDAESLVAIVGAVVPGSLVIGRQPELGPGIERRAAAVEPGIKRRTVI